MPLKNADAYLEECLKSNSDQSETNWELLVADDHSTDNSREILDSFQKKDSRIRVFTSEGRGIIAALQTAYSYAKGEFIHRMDADDCMPIHKLRLLKNKLLESAHGTVVTGKVHYFSEGQLSEGYQNYENWLNALSENESHWKYLYKECVIASPAWMIRREDFDASGAFNSSLYPEDYDLVFRWYAKGFKVKAVNEIVHYWREHAARTSRLHEHYQQKAFFRLKLNYFFKLHYDSNRPLVVFGAGLKGKITLQLLNEKGKLDAYWVNTIEDKSWTVPGEGPLYQPLSFKMLPSMKAPQIIVVVADADKQKKIKAFLATQNWEEWHQYFFFS